ncbi:hypothetical protein RFI_20777, partial [Reticulomyxa filosa]
KYLVMIIMFVLLILPDDYIRRYPWQICTPPIGVVCWLGAWLTVVTFDEKNARNQHLQLSQRERCKKCCTDFLVVSLMVLFIFGLIIGIAYALEFQTNPTKYLDFILGGGGGRQERGNASMENSNNGSNNGSGDGGSSGSGSGDNSNSNTYSFYSITLSVFFGIMLIYVEFMVVKKYQSHNTNIRYYFFNVQLCTCFLLAMIFMCSYVFPALIASLILCLWHTAIIWNDLLHKKMLNISKSEYVKKYRPTSSAPTSYTLIQRFADPSLI